MKIFPGKSASSLVSLLFITLITVIMVLTSAFGSYRLKKNLMAFQKREMKSSVDNFVLTIDSVRKGIRDHYVQQGIDFTEEEIKQATLSFLRDYVHKLDFANGAYLWINEVRDFAGGDSYAIRQLHGNLPETEGMVLSTSMEDAHGNLPYLTELEGVREKGEIFYQYYFKEYHSEKVSKKISYARLYRPYNWIVCTGTYLNSMYEPTGGVSRAERIVFYIFCFALFVFSLTLFAGIHLTNRSNSKRLQKEKEVLKGQVEHDALTGARSRAFGSKLLARYLENFKSEGKNYSIAILDIDNFKTINDSYGHNTGDMVIKNLVNTVKSLQTAGDHIIRWGGDEFILTFKEDNLDLDKVLGDINRGVAQQQIPADSGQVIGYAVSIGASRFSDKDKTFADTIKRIDDALYLAKRVKNSYYIIG